MLFDDQQPLILIKLAEDGLAISVTSALVAFNFLLDFVFLIVASFRS